MLDRIGLILQKFRHTNPVVCVTDGIELANLTFGKGRFVVGKAPCCLTSPNGFFSGISKVVCNKNATGPFK